MTRDEMRAAMTEDLEFWNAGLIQELSSFKRETTMFKMIVERMRGVICFSLRIGLITEEEKAELYYIYFNEDNEEE